MNWERAYQKRHSGEFEPHHDVVEAEQYFKKFSVSKILDLGCGDGRHIVFLAQKGYRLTGLDKAPTALIRTKQWLDRTKLIANLCNAEFSLLPFDNEVFDAVVSVQVLNHACKVGVEKAFHEVHRVLKIKGYFLATIAKFPVRLDWKNGRFEEIEPNTYMPVEGFEKGIPHHFFTEEELKKLLFGFTMIWFKTDRKTHNHYSVFCEKN